MHKDHGKFERGMAQYRKIRLTYLADEPRRELISLCGPLYFSRGKANKNEPDCYYFWDFEANEGRKFLALPPSLIVAMELTDETFSMEEIRNSKTLAERSFSDNDPSGF